MPEGDQNTTDILRPTRGLKNRNPGNIRYNPRVFWKGLSGQDNKGFCIFDTDADGIRAVVVDLHTHFVRDGQNTIRKQITTYAPPTENNTQAYCDHVAQDVGLDVDAAFDAFTKLLAFGLFKSICTMENGVQPYDEATIYAGIDSAFIYFAGVKA